MDIRKFSLVLTAAAALVPAISQASPEKTALNACAKAFATSITAPGAVAPAFKLNYQSHEFASALSDYYDREYTFYLKANSKKGLPLARATCSTDSRGNVIALTSTPMEESTSVLSAKLF